MTSHYIVGPRSGRWSVNLWGLVGGVSFALLFALVVLRIELFKGSTPWMFFGASVLTSKEFFGSAFLGSNWTLLGLALFTMWVLWQYLHRPVQVGLEDFFSNIFAFVFIMTSAKVALIALFILLFS